MSDRYWTVAGNDRLWARARVINRADGNDLDMIDAVQHVKEVHA